MANQQQSEVKVWVRFLPAEGETIDDVPRDEIAMTRVASPSELKHADQFCIDDTGKLCFGPSERPRKFEILYNA